MLTSDLVLRSIPDYVPPDTRTLGWGVLEWCSEYLAQPDGHDAGQPWRFTDEQVRIVLRWYEIDERGRFRYRRGVVRRLKGWGKDPLAAAIACAELCGPVRFGGWDTNGNPVGVDHPRPWIQVAAVNLTQTENTTMLFEGMITSQMAQDYRLDPGKTVIYAAGRGKIQAVTSSPRAIEGGRSSLVVAAETQNWIAGNDGHSMAAAIRRNLAKSNDGSGRLLEICNAHLEGEDSVAERTYEAWRLGALTDVMYDAVQAPEIDIADTTALTDAITACRGDAVWLDVERLVAEAQDPTTALSDVKRFYLNQPGSMAGERWMPADKWDAAREGFTPIEEHTEVVLAFDGSFNHDSTAIVVVTIEPHPRIDVVDCWEPPPDDQDWEVPIQDVEDTIRESCRRWKVREITADPYLWSRSLQILADQRLPVVEFPQHPSRMIPATANFMTAVQNGLLLQSGEERLRRHMLNAVLKTSTRGSMIAKDAKMSPRKIDLAVCAIMGYERAIFYRGKRYEVISPWEVLAGGDDGDSPEDIVEAMRRDTEKLMAEAIEEREAIDVLLNTKSGKQGPGTRGN